MKVKGSVTSSMDRDEQSSTSSLLLSRLSLHGNHSSMKSDDFLLDSSLDTHDTFSCASDDSSISISDITKRSQPDSLVGMILEVDAEDEGEEAMLYCDDDQAISGSSKLKSLKEGKRSRQRVSLGSSFGSLSASISKIVKVTPNAVPNPFGTPRASKKKRRQIKVRVKDFNASGDLSTTSGKFYDPNVAQAFKEWWSDRARRNDKGPVRPSRGKRRTSARDQTFSCQLKSDSADRWSTSSTTKARDSPPSTCKRQLSPERRRKSPERMPVS